MDNHLAVVRLELMGRQATPCTPEESSIFSHLAKKVLHAWWNLAPQKT